MNTKTSLLAIMYAPNAFGYVSTNTPLGITTKPFFGIEKTNSARTVPKPRHGGMVYDLGLGKNLPVSGRAATEITDLETATQFLVEYEGVNPFPSPRSSDTENPVLPTKRILPIIKPTRKSEDVLSIFTQNDSDSVPATIFQTKANLKMDLNTVWVEMMIHNQQMQLAKN